MDRSLKADYAARERELETAGFMSDPDYRDLYGAQETNGLGANGNEYHRSRAGAESVDWTTPGLHVTRLRLVSDPGFPLWDVSYCHGELNGKPVDVQLPFSQLPKRNMRGAIIEAAREARVYAKALGILENVSTIN